MLNTEPIEDRLAAITPYPWEVCHIIGTDPVEQAVHMPTHPDVTETPEGTKSVTVCRGMTGPNKVAHAEFIAHAPGDIVALLAEVERLRSWLTYAKSSLVSGGSYHLVQLLADALEGAPSPEVK